MTVQIYTDEFGEHAHTSYGNPYDPKRPITCAACIAAVRLWRQELCEKYGWDQWPEDISSCTIKED